MRHATSMLLTALLTFGAPYGVARAAQSGAAPAPAKSGAGATKARPADTSKSGGTNFTPPPDSEIKLMIYKLYYPSKRIKRVYAGYQASVGGKQVVVHHGPDIYYYDQPTSPKIRMIRYEHGRANGEMKQWSADGVLEADGTYVAGKKEGEFHQYYPSGKLKVVFQYANDEKSGESLVYDEAGVIRVRVPYRNGRKNGEAVQFTEDGKVRSRVNWRNDLKNGTETVFLPGGQKDSQINWKNGELDGEETYWDPETRNIQFKFNWVKGVKEGACREFFPDGQPRMLITFHEGKISGPFVIWTEAREKLSEGEYRENEPWSGTFRTYGDMPGSLFTFSYQNGRLLDGVLLMNNQPFSGKYEEWFTPGHLRRQAMYKDGRLDGVDRRYNYFNHLLSQATWSQNVLNGLYTQWYDAGEEPGQKLREVGVTNGRKDGPETVWTERGQPVAHGINRDGKPWKGYLPFVAIPADGSEPTFMIHNFNDGKEVAMNFKHVDLPPPEAVENIDRRVFDPTIERKTGYVSPQFTEAGGGGRSGTKPGMAEPTPVEWQDDPIDTPDSGTQTPPAPTPRP